MAEMRLQRPSRLSLNNHMEKIWTSPMDKRVMAEGSRGGDMIQFASEQSGWLEQRVDWRRKTPERRDQSSRELRECGHGYQEKSVFQRK